MKKKPKSSPRKPQPIKSQILIMGASGRMGKELISQLTGHPSLNLAAAVDSKEICVFDSEHTAVLKTSASSLSAVIQGADVIIDFSTPKAASLLLKALDSSSNKIVLIATTGLSPLQKSAFKSVAKKRCHKLLLAGNTSQGIATLAKLSAQATKQLEGLNFDVELTETHHRMKADAPSGTALLIADVIKSVRPELKIIHGHTQKRTQNSIGIHSVRGGGIFGEHEVRFLGDFEEIRLSHRALSRSLFASGALNLIKNIDLKLKFGDALELSEFLFID